MYFNDQRKIAIIGMGAVGSSSAYAMMISGLVNEMVLVDVNRDRARGEAMDLSHGASFIKPIKIYAGEYEDCLDADIIIFCAGVKQKPGENRVDLVFRNLEILKKALPRCINKKSDSILLMVSNPVDILTYAALRLGDLPPNRVIGSGTVLDSSRFRYMISSHCRVEARNVHAYVVGEHGDTEVPLWSLADIAGFPVADFCRQRGLPCMEKETLTTQVREAAYKVIALKGSTYYAVGLAIKRICESVLRDEDSILTVSGLMEGQHGIFNTCLSLPSLVNRKGRDSVLVLPMSPEEEKALLHSADMLKEIQQELDLSPLAFEARLTAPAPEHLYQKITRYH